MKNLTLFISVVIILVFTGCSGFMPSTPEFREAYKVQGEVHSLGHYYHDGAETSQVGKVLEGKRFYYKDSGVYAQTVADLLVYNGASKDDIYFVIVDIPVRGFAWEKIEGSWQRSTSSQHLVVEYKGYIIDNQLNAVLSVDDFTRSRSLVSKQRMSEPGLWKDL